jgi:putative protease
LSPSDIADAYFPNDPMAKQKFRPARLGGFSGAKAYIQYVEVLKKRRNAAGRIFCDAIKV